MEISCDAKVIKAIGAEMRSSYAQTLLNMVPVKQPAAFPLAFGAPSAGDRIKAILAYRPATKGAICISFAVMLLCFGLFAVNPVVVASNSFVSVASFYDGAGDAGYHVFRVHAQPSRRGNDTLQRASYDYAGGFSSLAEARLFFATEYFPGEDNLDFIPDDAVNHGFGFSFGPVFSWQGLNIAVATDNETRYYLLMDASTFDSDDLDFEEAINILITRLWTVSAFQEEYQYRIER